MSAVTWQPGFTLAHMEKQVVLAAFRFYHGNKTRTAQSLGIAIRTLEAKLESYREVEAVPVEATVNMQRMDIVEHAMRRYGGNQAVTARGLGVSLEHLQNELRIYQQKREYDERVAAFKRGETTVDPGKFTVRLDAVAVNEKTVMVSEENGEQKVKKSTPVVFDPSVDGREPFAKVPTQRPLPVREPAKVQEVLSRQNADAPAKKASK